MALFSRRLVYTTFSIFILRGYTIISSHTSALAQISVHEAEDTWPLGSVLELTQHHISEAVEEHEYLLVDFYAPWCEHCQKLAIEVSLRP